MANGGMWPMYPSSDRGGLLVQGIEEVPAGAAALGAAAIEQDTADALKRAEAKIRAGAAGSVIDLEKDEMAAVLAKADTPARPSALERALGLVGKGDLTSLDDDEREALISLVRQVGDVAGSAAIDHDKADALERADAKIRATKPGEIANLEDDEIRAVCAALRSPHDVSPPSDPPTAEPSSAARSALATAADVVEHRRAAYGSPKENFGRIAAFWTTALRDKLKADEQITLADVAQMMRLVKEARLIETPGHFDSLVDICGYVDCQQQVLS